MGLVGVYKVLVTGHAATDIMAGKGGPNAAPKKGQGEEGSQ